jgi:hypothetical protein
MTEDRTLRTTTLPRSRTDRLPRRRLDRRRPPKETTLKIMPIPQTCVVEPCTEVARFVVAVAAARDGSIRAARRCCAEHLEEAVFWAEGLVEVEPRARYALINRWWPWALELHEVPA